jgi:V8-like Glu-specific endopeptidase
MTISSVAYVINNTRSVRSSGVLITPDELLTAAHVVQDGNGTVSTSFSVSPGYSNGSAPLGTVGAKNVHSAAAGLSSIGTFNDYALIHLSTPVAGAGTMKVYSGFAGGTASFAGYPSSAGTTQINPSLTLTSPTSQTYASTTGITAGASGGPAYLTGSDGLRYAIGVVIDGNSGGSEFTRLSTSAVATIRGWLAEDGEDITAGPTVALPTSTDSLDFDATYYRTQNPDVVAAGLDPEQHYLAFGWREGRNPNALFNTTYYLAQNADVKAAGINPLVHFAQNGWKENRDPSAGFSVASYERLNPDVAAARIDPLNHYLNFGLSEGRRAAA